MACRIWRNIFFFHKDQDYIKTFTRAKSSLNHNLNSNEWKVPRENISESKILKVAIIGSPNAGKSTVINQIIGRRVLAMSKKVHTTKSCARAVYNEDSKQIVFLDTPGLISLNELEKYKLNESYFKGGEDAIIEADLIGVIHDVSNSFTRNNLDSKVLRLLHLYKHKESFLVMNKIDTIKTKRYLLDVVDHITKGKLKTEINNEHCSDEQTSPSEIDLHQLVKKNPRWENFSAMFMVSALLGNGINELKEYLLQKAYPGEWIFSPEEYTDKGPVNIIEEAVRSKLLEHLPQEVPYKVDVQLEYLDMDNEECITAVVLVQCNTDRTQRFIKGIQGERIKMIAVEAEQALEDAFLSNVHLKLVLTKKHKENEISNVN